MRKYRGILIAVAAAAMLCACFGKSDDPAKEKPEEYTTESVQPESRKAVIQILDETPAATQPETGSQESEQERMQESVKAAEGKENAGKENGGTKAAVTDAVRETEAAKVYSVEAFEKTMYATANVNVRASYTTKSKVLTSLTLGQKVKVTGRSANGWIRVIYDGGDAFVYQKYLSDSAPKTETAVTESTQSEINSTPPGNLEPSLDITTYPGNPSEDPPMPPGEIPIVEPAPVMTEPQPPGSSVTQSGPGVISPGGGSSRAENVVPGTGPGM